MGCYFLQASSRSVLRREEKAKFLKQKSCFPKGRTTLLGPTVLYRNEKEMMSLEIGQLLLPAQELPAFILTAIPSMAPPLNPKRFLKPFIFSLAPLAPRKRTTHCHLYTLDSSCPGEGLHDLGTSPLLITISSSGPDMLLGHLYLPHPNSSHLPLALKCFLQAERATVVQNSDYD